MRKRGWAAMGSLGLLALQSILVYGCGANAETPDIAPSLPGPFPGNLADTTAR